MTHIRRTSKRIIHRNPSQRRQRATEPPRPWWEPAPKRGRPRTSLDPKSTTRRGYGTQHQKLRAQYAKLIATGEARCARCGQPIHPGQRWALDHSDHPDAHQMGWYLGASHSACNNAAKRSQNNQPNGNEPYCTNDAQQQQQTPQQIPRAVQEFFRLNPDRTKRA